jgi:hypothetical protein
VSRGVHDEAELVFRMKVPWSGGGAG